MEYYPAHKDNQAHATTGIFTYLKPDVSVVGDRPINNNRALDGDTVYHDGSIVTGIVARGASSACIAGILHVTSMRRHGYTKRGLPIYKFIPLSWRYPSFMVSSSVAKTDIDLYALVAFSEWTVGQKYPSGRCINILGPVSDRVATDQALIHKNGLYIRKYRVTDQIIPEQSTERRQHITETILTIDPDGSTDRDDAFHIDSQMQHIYVHIADVDAYFPSDGPYESELERRMASVYATDRVYHMLPEEYATDIISLNTNGNKLAITVVLKYGLPDGKLSGVCHYRSLIRVTRCLTYSEAQDSSGSSDPVGNAIYNLSQAVGCDDTHKMIEMIMVATNAYVGMTTYNMGCALLRVQPSAGRSPAMPDIIKGRTSKVAAEYILASPGDGKDTYHSSLDISQYSQFTSPMRRLGDLYVQRMLKHRLHPKIVSLERHNRYYRDQNIVRLADTQLGRTEGYIIGYCPRRNMVRVYLPDYNMEYSYPLFSNLQCYSVDDMDDCLLIHRQSECLSVPKYRLISIELIGGSKAACLRDRVIMRIPSVTAFLQL